MASAIHTYNKVHPISVHLCIRTRTDVFARAHVVHESWERTSVHHLTRRGVSGYHPEADFKTMEFPEEDSDLRKSKNSSATRHILLFDKGEEGEIGLMLECQTYTRLASIDACPSNRDFT